MARGPPLPRFKAAVWYFTKRVAEAFTTLCQPFRPCASACASGRSASTIGFQALAWSPGEQAHPMAKILRTWTFWIRTELRQEAHAYLEAGRLQEMRAAPGNRRVSAVFRERQDGTTAVVIMSIWDSLESIRALVGSDHDQPWIAPEELARVFDSDNKVGHYSLSDASVRELLPPEWCEEIA